MALRYEGFSVESAANGKEAIDAVGSFRPHLMVLDIMLPDMEGFDVARKLTAERAGVPIVFLTARDATEDRVHGLLLGGDDYLTKPFSVAELAARLRALMRRAAITQARTATLSVADLTLNEDSREVRRAGRLIELTPTEFDLLRYLMRNAKTVLTKSQILDRVWQYDFGGNANVVELYISYLRRKLDQDALPLIHTVRGVGYVLRPPMTG
jgi:two-component system OmpR family response regulator